MKTDIWLSRSLLISKHIGVYAQGRVGQNPARTDSHGRGFSKSEARFRLLQLFARVIRLDRLGDDGAGGVASLVILALRGDGPGDVTGAQTPGYRQTTEESGHCRGHDLVNFLLVHDFSFR